VETLSQAVGESLVSFVGCFGTLQKNSGSDINWYLVFVMLVGTWALCKVTQSGESPK
jgi:hypothetical protein